MSDTAVLIIDMLNDYRHSDADRLADSVATIVDPLTRLIEEAAERDDVDLVYVNDNRGDFTADFGVLIDAARRGKRPDLVEPVIPAPGCRLLAKVRHSVFFATALDYLLGRLGTRRLVLTGQVTEQCILYSALDAYVRHYDVVVPPDAVAHIDAGLGQAALAMMRRNMEAQLLPSAHCLP
jgi:nicotinamidase-related amidase